MVDKGPTKTPEQIEQELSVTNFTKQQVRTLTFEFGGMALGAAAGYGAAKAGLGKSWGKNAVVQALGGAKSVLVLGGTVVGSMIGGIASLYEHWVKVEREQLNVQEINKDVSKLMQKRTEFENTLDKQQEIIDAMLEKHKAGTSKAGIVTAQRELAASAENTRA